MKIENTRHSLSHLLAMAVLEKFPDAKLGIGPIIENGFYYDFLLPRSLAPEDLKDFEKEIKKLISQKLSFISKKITAVEAKKIFKDQPFKLELINEYTKEKRPLSIYKTGDIFIDLCAGGHVKNSGEINADSFKLTSIAGAYWRGDEKNPQLQRIYGVAFESKKELEHYLWQQEEAKKRDHRIIGKNLELFVFSDLVGKGLPLFTEKGSIIRRELERFIVDEEIRRGYKHVYTPELAKVELYKTSGHYPYYKDTMYPVMKIDEEELILRPMTCPHHFQLYASKPHTYKELPFRIAELAKQFRYEKSGELTGLMRVRSFCLADAHIICKKEQATDEINNVLDLIEYTASVLGLKKGEDYHYRLSLGDRKNAKKYYKDDKSWNLAENVLRKVLKERKSPFFETQDEAAFYGPKIDIQMKNFSGKEDTAFTVQYDFVMPKKFDLTYIDEVGKKQEPIVIHRSSIGAVERVMAFLIEHYAGAFPVWLSPVQVRVLNLTDRNQKYAKKIYKELKDSGIRVELDDTNETVGKKIREAELQKIPYILIVGDKEEKNDSVAVRKRGKGDLGSQKLPDFTEKILKEIKNKII